MNPADDPKVHAAIQGVIDGANAYQFRMVPDDLLAALDGLGVELAPKGLTDAARAMAAIADEDVIADEWAGAAEDVEDLIRRWDEEHR